jgi:hypothetical protein
MPRSSATSLVDMTSVRVSGRAAGVAIYLREARSRQSGPPGADSVGAAGLRPARTGPPTRGHSPSEEVGSPSLRGFATTRKGQRAGLARRTPAAVSSCMEAAGPPPLFRTFVPSSSVGPDALADDVLDLFHDDDTLYDASADERPSLCVPEPRPPRRQHDPAPVGLPVSPRLGRPPRWQPACSQSLSSASCRSRDRSVDLSGHPWAHTGSRM